MAGLLLLFFLPWYWGVGALVIGLTPWLLRESRVEVARRHFDVAGATTITSSLMLLVYAMTRATQHGWSDSITVGALAVSAALAVSFVVIELRSKAPLLPMRIFKLRTLSAANGTALLLASAVFSQFFLLTLYMQQVLHYSAIKTGVAYIGLTVSIVAFSAVAQTLATRIGVRRVLPVGLLLSAAGLVLYARLPVHGHYFWDVFPAFLLSGIGLALSFVPTQIASLTGVQPAEAGAASGLINTSQQIGGAIGLAAATTIATTYTSRYVSAHAGVTASSGSALTHGFEIAFYVLAALATLGAIVSAVFIESRPKTSQEEAVEVGAVQMEAAA